MTANISSVQNRQFVRGTVPIEGESQELVDVLQKIVQNAGALLEVSSCSVALLDVTGTTLVTLAALNRHGRKPRRTRFRLNEGVAGWVAEHREPLVLNDVSRDARFKRLGRIAVGSMVCVPLIDDGTFIGTLTASSPEKQAFSPRKLQMLIIFAEQAVLTIITARQQEQLRAILASSSDGIAIVGVNACFIEANPAFGRIFGIDPQQVVGMECMELFGCEGANSHGCCRDQCMVHKAFQQQQALPYVEIDLTIQGASHSVGLSITPVSANGRPLCLIVARDVTAIRDATRMKANFLSLITHELRSPLNAISGYLDLALTGIGGELTEQQREFVQRARAGSEHLYALIEDLLLVSRADAGQLRLNRVVTSLQEIVANAIEELELMALDGGITITVDIASDFPPIYADPVRIQQVLRNLMSNGLQFTASGGRVTVSASISANAKNNGATASEVAEDGERKFVRVQVSDTGCGIAPEQQQRIFERFYQIPHTPTSRSSGQGLGLAIVKMIVELHGGQVMVESTPDQGSTFSCLLPCLLG